MKAEIISLVLVLAVAVGLVISSGGSSDFMTGMFSLANGVHESDVAGDDAKPIDISGFKVGISTKKASNSENDEPTETDDAISNTTTGTFSASGGRRRSSGSSSSYTPPLPPPRAAVGIEPALVNVNVSDTFSIDVNIGSEANVFAVSFDVKYNKSIIIATNAVDGDFLTQGGVTTYPDTPIEINNTAGLVMYDATRLGAVGGVSGSGVLIKIDFQAVQSGQTTIEMINVALADDTPYEGDHKIGFDVSQGVVNVQ